MIDNNTEFPNMDSILPYGEKLIPLLNASYITKSNISHLLRKRGIYFSNPDKEETISLLRNIIITPDEFEYLCSLQRTKEDQGKKRTETIEIDSEENLFDLSKKDHFKVNDLLKGENLNYRIEGVASISVNNPNHLFYEFTIQRNNLNKDWANSRSRHYGRVDFEKKNNEIRSYSEYTSEETREIINKIRKRFYSTIKDSSNISAPFKPIKITYDSFENTNRIEFLFSLIEEIQLFKLNKVVDISFGPDPKKNLPAEIQWMENKVTKLSVIGKGIKDIEYFTNKKYYDSLLVEAIEAIIEIEIENTKYLFNISYGFINYFNTEIPDTEFEYSIGNIQDDAGTNKKNRELERTIQKTIDSFKNEKFNQYKKLSND